MSSLFEVRAAATFSRQAGLGAVGTVVVGSALRLMPSASAATKTLALAGTDGYITVPGREANPIYIFGFIPVDPTASISSLISTYKGHAQHTAPTLDFVQDDDIKITLTNLASSSDPTSPTRTPSTARIDVPSPLNTACRGVGGGADRQAGHVLLPSAPGRQ